jgi:hypothetical protein
VSRPSRSLRRGKCDAIPEGQEPRAGKLLPPTTLEALRTMPQTAVIIWILIIFALIVPALAGVRLLPSPW